MNAKNSYRNIELKEQSTLVKHEMERTLKKLDAEIGMNDF